MPIMSTTVTQTANLTRNTLIGGGFGGTIAILAATLNPAIPPLYLLAGGTLLGGGLAFSSSVAQDWEKFAIQTANSVIKTGTVFQRYGLPIASAAVAFFAAERSFSNYTIFCSSSYNIGCATQAATSIGYALIALAAISLNVALISLRSYDFFRMEREQCQQSAPPTPSISLPLPAPENSSQSASEVTAIVAGSAATYGGIGLLGAAKLGLIAASWTNPVGIACLTTGAALTILLNR